MSNLKDFSKSPGQGSIDSSKEVQQQFHHSTKNIDETVRPIIQSVQMRIENDFMALHNKYLFQSYKRKVQCYENSLKPQQSISIETSKNHQKSKKSPTQKDLSPRPQTQQQKPTSQQVLDYYSCFDSEIKLANQRYQKIYKKSEENKMRLINCVDRCSGHSKTSNQLFQKCSQGCKSSYSQIMAKLYSNFYTKFLQKQKQ